MNSEVTKVPFEPEHLQFIQLRDQEAKSMDVDKIAQMAKASAVCETYICDGYILGIAGHIKIWEGVLEVYIIPSIYLARYALLSQRLVKKTLDGWSTTCHRMQTSSIADTPTDKWMLALGFKWEGRLEKYTSDKVDYNQWARLT